MSATGFALDPRLEADWLPVGEFPLSRLMIKRDCRLPWFILVPRRAGAVEIHRLSADDQRQLFKETMQVAEMIEATFPCDKLNIGALGNIVSQLHVHLVARRVGDFAWPGAIWGVGTAEPWQEAALEATLARVRAALPALTAPALRG
ncbi:HIT domain-containing protein [Radicibacter daui]|uniref:HIT domain-containing protein n=1 Tax=Radicibacter daui TaxID=3064829 RepID=UPI004046B5D9